MSLIDLLPKIEGEYRLNANIAKNTWFGVGGNAEVLFRPKDVKDLAIFIQNVPKDITLNIIGVGSNLLIRDKGIKGVVIKLGRAFVDMGIKDDILTCGAGCLNYNVAQFAKDNNASGLEFLIGIPGSIGGSIMMNAGSYGSDISANLISAKAIDPDGVITQLRSQDFGFTYRGNSLSEGWIFVEAKFKIQYGKKEQIEARMADINKMRESSQPIRSKTSGSTFKNPPGLKAWELIDLAGGRGMRVGGAVMSEMHCNFIINDDNATAKDIEDLGEKVRDLVLKKSGVELTWEIKIIGEK